VIVSTMTSMLGIYDAPGFLSQTAEYSPQVSRSRLMNQKRELIASVLQVLL